MLSTLLAASPADLAVLRGTDSLDPSGLAVPTVDLGGVGPVAFAALHAAAHDVPLDDDLIDRVLGKPLEMRGGGEQLLFGAGTDLATTLGQASDDELAAVAARWAASEEMTLDGWTAAACASVLGELRSLARGDDRAWFVAFSV